MAAELPVSGGGRSERLPPEGFLLIAGITLFWGVNWPAMKVAFGEIPVWTFRSLCLVVGGVGLLGLAKLGGRSLRIPPSDLKPLMLSCLFNVIGWHLFSGYGISLIPAGRAAIIAFTMPIWTSLFGAFFLGERMTAGKWAGLALGTAGLAVLMGEDIAVLGAAPLGTLFMFGAAISWALGTIVIKKTDWTISSGTLVGWQMSIGAVPIILGMLIIEGVPRVEGLSEEAIWATLYVLALPILFCQWAYFRLVRLFPAALAAIGTLMIPVVGVFSSALLLGEPIGPGEVVALGLVCSALAVVLGPPALSAWRLR